MRVDGAAPQLSLGVHNAPANRSECFTVDDGLLLARSTIMQMKTSLLKWIAGSVLVATTAGVLSGYIIETRPHHHYYSRSAVIVR